MCTKVKGFHRVKTTHKTLFGITDFNALTSRAAVVKTCHVDECIGVGANKAKKAKEAFAADLLAAACLSAACARVTNEQLPD